MHNLFPQLLAHSVVGASLEDAQFDEEVDSQPPPDVGGASRYEVVGTLRDPRGEKPDWVSEVREVGFAAIKTFACIACLMRICLLLFLPCSSQSSAPDSLLPALLTCDVVIYHITEAPGQEEEASWAVQG